MPSVTCGKIENMGERSSFWFVCLVHRIGKVRLYWVLVSLTRLGLAEIGHPQGLHIGGKTTFSFFGTISIYCNFH